MSKNMDKGNTGRTNKPKLSVQEKKLKKKMKLMSKQGMNVSAATP